MNKKIYKDFLFIRGNYNMQLQFIQGFHNIMIREINEKAILFNDVGNNFYSFMKYQALSLYFECRLY